MISCWPSSIEGQYYVCGYGNATSTAAAALNDTGSALNASGINTNPVQSGQFQGFSYVGQEQYDKF